MAGLLARVLVTINGNVIKQNQSRTTTVSEITEEVALMELHLSRKTRSLTEKKNIQKKTKREVIPWIKCDVNGGKICPPLCNYCDKIFNNKTVLKLCSNQKSKTE